LQLFGYATVSFHLGAESSTIDIDSAKLTEAQLQEAVARANQIIDEDRPMRIYYCTVEEAFARGVRKVAPGIERVRVIEMEGVEFNACGGTHVHSTREIGLLLCRATEKVKQGTRIEFVCGERALSTAMRDYEELRRAGSLLSAGVWQIADQIATLTAEAKRRSKRIEQLELELVAALAPQLANAGEAGNGIIVRRFNDREAPFVKMLAQHAARIAQESRSPLILLVAAEQPSPTLIFVRNELAPADRVHIGELLKLTLVRFSGRGGGSASLAQGGIPDIAQLDTALKFAEEQARAMLKG
jgi:alanyl-tRNA synthetase